MTASNPATSRYKARQIELLELRELRQLVAHLTSTWTDDQFEALVLSTVWRR
jgi:hypothetical protein